MNEPIQTLTHQVPFGTTTTAPLGSLSHGFGMSPSSSFNVVTPSISWGTPTPSANPGGWRSPSTWGSASKIAVKIEPIGSFGSNSRRRRRSSTPPSDSDEETGSAVLRIENSRTKGKKLRLGEGGMNEIKDEVDLRKSLASLSKDSLLTLVESLLNTTPALRPIIIALLPLPTLEATLTTLQTLERNLLSALPTGSQMREDYVWGRVKLPLEEYVTQLRSYLNVFCNPNLEETSEIGHPSTTFDFLYALTSSLRRVEAQLPSPPSLQLNPNYPTIRRNAQDLISTTLLPLLINHWHLFLTKLIQSIFHQGKIISSNMLKSWWEKLEGICITTPGVFEGLRNEGGAKRACEGVKERFRKELGGLIGLKEIGEEMEEEEEL